MIRGVRIRVYAILFRLLDWRTNRKGILCVEIDCSSNGFFAQMSGLVPILMYCCRSRLTPYIVLSSKAYADSEHGPNFLEYFFDGPVLTRTQLRALKKFPIRRVERFCDLPYWERNQYPSLREGHRFFNSYYQIKSTFVEEARSFHRKELKGLPALGVHFRGTDKVSEATELKPDEVVASILEVMRIHREIKCIFLSTDAEHMISYCRQKLPQFEVVVRQDEVRSSDEVAVHCKMVGRPYEKGKDAIMNCIILSQCAVLLKSMSHLSGWSKVFNPDLKVYLMNRPDKNGVIWLGFPEEEMVRESWFIEVPREENTG